MEVQLIKKKIVFVITDFGGFNVFLSELSVSLANKYEVHVITSPEKVIKINDKYKFTDYGIKFHFFEFPRNFNLVKHYKVSKEVQRKITEIHPDFVSMHFSSGIFTTIFAGKLKYKNKGMIHGLGYTSIENIFKKFIFMAVEFMIANRVDEVWVINDQDYDAFKKYFPNKVKLLPTKGLGCDMTIFNKNNFSESQLEFFRNNLNIEKDDFVISYVGRYVQHKGYHLVINTMQILKEKYNLSNVKLITMGGKDSIHPTGLSESQEKFLSSTNNIIDVGFKSSREIAEYLAISDLLFFPSKKEGMPISIMEALAMEVPVLTVDARGCNNLVNNDKNGIIAPIDSSGEYFAKIVNELVSDTTKIERFKKYIKQNKNLLSRDNFVKHETDDIDKHFQ